MFEIVFWQKIISPHMAYLAEMLAVLGQNVSYVAAQPMSRERMALGWTAPEIKDIKVQLVTDANQVESLLTTIAPSAVHIVQGVRGNGYLTHVLKILKRRRLHFGVVLETIKEPFVACFAKRVVYRWKLSNFSTRPDFVLAIGENTPAWIAARNYPVQRIFPFTYFLESKEPVRAFDNRRTHPLRIGFAGQLNKGKGLDILIDALTPSAFTGAELIVVGGGPLEAEFKKKAKKKLTHVQVRWLGQLPMDRTREVIGDWVDCIVLPSRHDGWGVVVSEALTAGVPAICSDACGAAEAVRASGVGGVFSKGNSVALSKLLMEMLNKGRLSDVASQDLAEWGRCFAAVAGAEYLIRILQCVYFGGTRPLPPWAIPPATTFGKPIEKIETSFPSC